MKYYKQDGKYWEKAPISHINKERGQLTVRMLHMLFFQNGWMFVGERFFEGGKELQLEDLPAEIRAQLVAEAMAI